MGNSSSFSEYLKGILGKDNGFVRLPVEFFTFIAQDGKRDYYFPNELGLWVTICAHANYENVSFASLERLAILAGIAKETARGYVKKLIEGRIVERWDGSKIHIKNLNGDYKTKDIVFFRKGIVHRGIWAFLTPTAKKLFIYFLVKSKPGLAAIEEFGSYFNEMASLEFGKDGVRSFPGQVYDPQVVEDILGCHSTARKEAYNQLEKAGLVKLHDEYDIYILPNHISCYQNEVLQRVFNFEQRKKETKSNLSLGAKKSIAHRRGKNNTDELGRKIKTQMEEPIR